MPPRHPAVALSGFLVSCLLLSCLGLGIPEAQAARVLPVAAQGKLLVALEPTKPGQEISGGWSLGDVKLTHDRVTITLRSGEQRHDLLLLPRDGPGGEGIELGTTASFRCALVHEPPAPPALTEAAQTLIQRVRSGDDGRYYRATVEEGTKEPGSPTPTPGPTIPVAWSLALGCLLMLLSGVWALRSTPVSRGDLMPAVALFVLALALRVWLGPHTFLHENSRGPRELEALLGWVPIVRPMGGQLALQTWVASLSGASVGTMTGVTTIGSALAVPVLYALGRVCSLGRWASAVSALLLASLPVAVRVGTSADAFPAATTCLLLAVVGIVATARTTAHSWLIFAAAAAGLAGLFRPTLYAVVPFLGLGLILLSDPGKRFSWFSRRTTAAAAVTWAILALPDVLPSLETLGQGSALTMGWWSRPDLHSWPMIDPTVTPSWLFPLSGGGAILAGIRRPDLRPPLAWLLILAGALSFLYSSDNGWPASLRYAVSYAWIFPLFVGLGLAALPGKRPWIQPAALIAVGALALSPVWTHGPWIGHKSAQQLELDFQRDEVIPALLAGPSGTVITPWPTLDDMSGTLLTTPLRQKGWRVVGHEDAEAMLNGERDGSPVYWYRGLACWARPVRGARAPAGLHPVCADLERSAPWRPARMHDLPATSDADWIVLGDGSPTVEVGLLQGSF